MSQIQTKRTRSVKNGTKQKEVEVPVLNSYRMGNWTVTQLRDELRVRQLPITGKKSELIDRLENSPIKTVNLVSNSIEQNAKNSSPFQKLVENVQFPSNKDKKPDSNKSTPMSPLNPLEIIKQGLVDGSPLRGRGKVRSDSLPQSQKMLTRSRSVSLTKGTLITWTQQPVAVLGNFLLKILESKLTLVLVLGIALIGGIFSTILRLKGGKYLENFVESLIRVLPIFQVFADGLVSHLGLSRNCEFCRYVSKASHFMYDCSSGNIERNSETGRLRCSAAPLNILIGGLVGRLFWLTREQFFAWSFGTLFASTLIFFVTRTGRSAFPLLVNQSFRKVLNTLSRFSVLLAILPVELLGLVAGFSGFESKNFFLLLLVKIFIGIPLELGSRIIFAKLQKGFLNQSSSLQIISQKFDFFINSESKTLLMTFFIRIRQTFSIFIYVVICAFAIQVIANSRVLKKLQKSKLN